MWKTGHKCVCKTWFSIRFKTKRDNAQMTGTCEDKEVKYKEMESLILDILGKDSLLEGLDSDNCVRAEETVVDSNRHSYLYLIPLPCYV
jgi:hypothetical protein